MSKKKIFYALSVFLLLGMTMSVLNARAHPPINVHMEYHTSTSIYPYWREKLDIIYTHGVSDPEVHYLSSIEVWVNVTQRWVDHHHDVYYWDLDNYAIAIPPPLDPSDIDPFHSDYFTEAPLYPTVPPNYTFLFDEQPTNITTITESNTLIRYFLDIGNLSKTGEIIDDPPWDDGLQRFVPYLKDAGRTNITVRANCTLPDWKGNPSSLTEHYYVGLPYYNPHLTFAEAAAPATVSTIIVFALLYLLPKLGQKSAPKLKEDKSRI